MFEVNLFRGHNTTPCRYRRVSFTQLGLVVIHQSANKTRLRDNIYYDTHSHHIVEPASRGVGIMKCEGIKSWVRVAKENKVNTKAGFVTKFTGLVGVGDTAHELFRSK